MELADYIINGDYLNASPVRPKMVGDSITYKLPWGSIIKSTYADVCIIDGSCVFGIHIYRFHDLTNGISTEMRNCLRFYSDFKSGWMQICHLSKEASEKFSNSTDDNH